MMKVNILVLVWLAAGIVLLVAEFVDPGVVLGFFGVGALIVSLAVYLGIVKSTSTSVIIWLSLSFMLFIFLRRIILKFIPSKSNYQYVEEDVDMVGKVVGVVSRIDGKSSDGRISYSGTTWPATSRGTVIEPGRKVRILYRENISFVVELFEEDDNTKE
jgi:membrane protein implicated in regulation of membrane protease activity